MPPQHQELSGQWEEEGTSGSGAHPHRGNRASHSPSSRPLSPGKHQHSLHDPMGSQSRDPLGPLPAPCRAPRSGRELPEQGAAPAESARVLSPSALLPHVITEDFGLLYCGLCPSEGCGLDTHHKPISLQVSNVVSSSVFQGRCKYARVPLGTAHLGAAWGWDGSGGAQTPHGSSPTPALSRLKSQRGLWLNCWPKVPAVIMPRAACP